MEWEKKSAGVAAERERRQKLQLATVAIVQPGEMQSERDFNEQGEDSSPDRVMGRAARRGRNWFSFDLPVDASHPMAVMITCSSDERRKRTFDILVEGQPVREPAVENQGSPRGIIGGTTTISNSAAIPRGEPRFFDVEFAVPASLTSDKQRVTVRLQAAGGNEIAAVFGIRMIRADAAR